MEIYLITLCVLANAIGIYGDFSRINCGNKELNANGCVCHFEDSLNLSVLDCPSKLASNLNVLPSLPGNVLRVINAFEKNFILKISCQMPIKTHLILHSQYLAALNICF